jgi:HK97 family phage prohead protease
VSVATQPQEKLEVRSISVPIEIRADQTGNGGFSGYANLAGIVDEYDSLFEPGCYQELDALKRDGFISCGHDWYEFGPGYITEARSDQKGLWISAEFHGDPESQAIRQKVQERIAAGKTVHLSIGFFTLESRVEQRDGQDIRIISKCLVKEVALVNVPGTPGSKADEARGMRFADEFQAARDAVGAITRRTRQIAEMRGSLTDEKRGQIVTLIAELSPVLEDLRSLLPVEAPDPVSDDVLLELEAAFQNGS